jgi:hypothetical protein
MPEFADLVEALSTRSKIAERQALTEEATKTAVVLPFLQTLGFDVFNLDEVTPEFVSDVGTKKGEKVDFAVKIDGKIAMLVEAKPINTRLSDTQYNQLFRYFTVTEARLAVLTNGREAWFFSDIEDPNKMDQIPFFTFDFQQYDRKQIDDLARFQKANFAIESILEAASALKYTRAASIYLKKQIDNPDEEFVRLIGRQIHEGSITKSVIEQIKPSIQAAMDEIVRYRIQDRLGISLKGEPSSTKTEEIGLSEAEVITTEDEISAFMIIRAILARIVDVERVFIRDAKSYCAILMDNNNRKPICRLYFNSSKSKSIGIFDWEKKEIKSLINKISDIYNHAEAIESAVKGYL